MLSPAKPGTPRRVQFVDADEQFCTISDSSLADDECIWFGVQMIRGCNNTVRMHLTRNMARRIARALHDWQEGRPVDVGTFLDRNGNTCGIMLAEQQGSPRLRIGIFGVAGPGVGTPMMISLGMIGTILPYLLAFVSSGTILGEGLSADLEDAAPALMDVKIPSSMVARADVGETGVSAQALVEAFLELFDHNVVSTPDGPVSDSGLGHDRTVRLSALADKLRPLVDRN